MKSDRQYKNEGRKIAFGRRQWRNPTPVKIKWIFRTVLLLSTLYILLVQPLLHITPETKLQIDMFIAGLQPAILAITKFFGWDPAKLN